MDYGDFLGSLEPVMLGLDSSTLLLNRELFWAQPRDTRRVLSSKYVLAHVADDYFDVEAAFSLSIQWVEDDGPVVQALRIECVFTGHFHTEAGLDP